MYIFVGTNSCNTKLIKSSSRFPRFALWLYISHLWMADGPYLGLIPIVLKWPMILTLVSWEPAVRPLLTLAVNGQSVHGRQYCQNVRSHKCPLFLKSPCEVWSHWFVVKITVPTRTEAGVFRDVWRDSLITFQLMSAGAAPARAPLPGSGSGSTPSSGAWTWSRWPAAWSPRPWWCTETRNKISTGTQLKS